MNSFETLTGIKYIDGDTVHSELHTAIKQLEDSLKSSFGPLGLDKILIDETGDVIITNDGATIIKNLHIENPAAQLVANLAKAQDDEMGDGTTGVILLASKLIRNAFDLMRKNMPTHAIIAGYKEAYVTAMALINNKLKINIENEEAYEMILKNFIRTTISSKVIRADNEHFINMIYEASKLVNFKTEKINILKQKGSFNDSYYIKGYAINATPVNINMPQEILNPRIALLDFNLTRKRFPVGTKINVENPENLKALRNAEITYNLSRVEKLVNAGVNIILTQHAIDDFCIRPIGDINGIAIKRIPMRDFDMLSSLLKIPKLNIYEVDNFENIEDITTTIDKIKVNLTAEGRFTTFNFNNASSIILSGINETFIEEVHRSVHDALASLSVLVDNKYILPGGGAAEMAIALHLERLALTKGSIEAEAIFAFSDSLIYLIEILLENSTLDSNNFISRLRTAQLEKKDRNNFDCASNLGVEVMKGKIQNNILNGVVESSEGKEKSIRAAVESAISIIRIGRILTVPVIEKKVDECH